MPNSFLLMGKSHRLHLRWERGGHYGNLRGWVVEKLLEIWLVWTKTIDVFPCSPILLFGHSVSRCSTRCLLLIYCFLIVKEEDINALLHGYPSCESFSSQRTLRNCLGENQESRDRSSHSFILLEDALYNPQAYYKLKLYLATEFA